MGKYDRREGSVFHVDSPDGHRYFIISDRDFSRCANPSESRYTHGCRCDGCRDTHVIGNRRRRVSAAARRCQEKTERTRPLPETDVRHIYPEVRGDAG